MEFPTSWTIVHPVRYRGATNRGSRGLFVVQKECQPHRHGLAEIEARHLVGITGGCSEGAISWVVLA
jgi:hypothetical protein